MEKSPLWECNGTRKQCEGSWGCHLNGGPCYLTSDENYAKRKDLVHIELLYGGENIKKW